MPAFLAPLLKGLAAGGARAAASGGARAAASGGATAAGGATATGGAAATGGRAALGNSLKSAGKQYAQDYAMNKLTNRSSDSNGHSLSSGQFPPPAPDPISGINTEGARW
jgi:hypothetical protein